MAAKKKKTASQEEPRKERKVGRWSKRDKARAAKLKKSIEAARKVDSEAKQMLDRLRAAKPNKGTAQEVATESYMKGWDEALDHTKWHMVVDSDGNVLKPIAPHVPGSIGDILPAGAKVVQIDDPTEDERRLYKQGNAKVKGRKLVASDIQKVRAHYAKLIDEVTTERIRAGFKHGKQVISLSPNAIAKLTALTAVPRNKLTDPYPLSALDESIIELGRDEAVDLAYEALAYYARLIGDGASYKMLLMKHTKEVDMQKVLEMQSFDGHGDA